MILAIQHIDIEALETLGDYFLRKGHEIEYIKMSPDAQLPKDLTAIEAVVSLGGPMNVYEEDLYPFLARENEFIQKVVNANIPFLGLCLGAQLLAKAYQAQVVRSPYEEIGFSKISLTEEGQKDPLFKGLDPTLDVFQWHGDMFNIPKGAALLASSDQCPHQAFRYGPNAYGLQFHVEITHQNIAEWAQAYLKMNDPLSEKKLQNMLSDYEKCQKQFDEIARILYDNFYQLIVNPHSKEKTHQC